MHYRSRPITIALTALSIGLTIVGPDANNPVFASPIINPVLFDGRSYFVSRSGRDTYPGTADRPLRTIQRAVNLARAGDTVIVKKGTYAERVVLRYAGEPGRPIRLIGEAGTRPIIQPAPPGNEPPGQALLLQAVEGYQSPIGWITIEHFDLKGGHDGVKFYNAHDVEIRDCRIIDSWNQGIIGTGNRVTIDRNVIEGSGISDPYSNQIHGIYGTGTAFTITNNIIHSNAAYGIQVAGRAYDAATMTGPEFAGAKDWIISNNVLAYNYNRSGIVLWQAGVENCLIQNNIFFWNGAENGIRFYGQGGKRHLLRNNVFYPIGTYLSGSEPDSYVEVGSKQVNPRFVSAGSLDFRLQSTSAAVDTGATQFAPLWDYIGKARPQGNGVDIGAYERAK